MTGYCNCLTTNNIREFQFEPPCPPPFFPIESFQVHALGQGLNQEVVCNIARQCYVKNDFDNLDECVPIVTIPEVIDCWSSGLCPGLIGAGGALLVVIIIIAVCFARRRRKSEPNKLTCCVFFLFAYGRTEKISSNSQSPNSSMDSSTQNSTDQDNYGIVMDNCAEEHDEEKGAKTKL